jgi:hypothetical protein
VFDTGVSLGIKVFAIIYFVLGFLALMYVIKNYKNISFK